MTNQGSTPITLAAVQARSLPGQVPANLDHATSLVEQAAAAGASVVVLPELFSSGCLTSRAIWDAAEASDGPTARWLAATAARLGIYLGAGTAQSDGADFYDVFMLAGPDGEIAGRGYKTNAAASIFRRGRSVHVIDTAIGRIGVGICADNQYSAQLRLMHELRADLILMPCAWPTPITAAGLVSAADVATLRRRITELPVLYARALGVPVVLVNQVGPLPPIAGMLGRLMDPQAWRLRGQSRIVDSDGSLAGALADDERVLVAEVVMDRDRKHRDELPDFGGWLQPGPLLERRAIIPVDIVAGRLSYALSRTRVRKAEAALRPAMDRRRLSSAMVP